MSPQGINIPFALGELLLGVEAFFVRDWVDLQLLAHGPVLVLTSLAWVCPESVRWLLAKGGAHTDMRNNFIKLCRSIY